MEEEAIQYDLWIEEALRSVVRRALDVAALQGLPGKHHYYITFDTCAPGVVMAPHLKARYPEEMTIVLQHQFDNLLVDDAGMAVTVYFGGKPERLAIPFPAMTGFADPAVNFGLQLKMVAAQGAEAEGDDESPSARPDSLLPIEEPVEDGDNIVPLDAFRGKNKKK